MNYFSICLILGPEKNYNNHYAINTNLFQKKQKLAQKHLSEIKKKKSEGKNKERGDLNPFSTSLLTSSYGVVTKIQLLYTFFFVCALKRLIWTDRCVLEILYPFFFEPYHSFALRRISCAYQTKKYRCCCHDTFFLFPIFLYKGNQEAVKQKE